MSTSKGRPGFREWLDTKPDPGWKQLPLTHITKGIIAEDISRTKKLQVRSDQNFNKPCAYMFYGRPAYKIKGDGSIKFEAACPYCFIFNSDLVGIADEIFAFDTGAFLNRMYSHVIMDEMDVDDFSIYGDTSRINKLIGSAFPNIESYFEGDISNITSAEIGAKPWEFHAKAYLQLLSSTGRNEPDDRICSVELIFNKDIEVGNYLRAIIAPHTIWNEKEKAPWLESLHNNDKIEISTYIFVPGRNPIHYHSQLEASVRELYKKWGLL